MNNVPDENTGSFSGQTDETNQTAVEGSPAHSLTESQETFLCPILQGAFTNANLDQNQDKKAIPIGCAVLALLVLMVFFMRREDISWGLSVGTAIALGLLAAFIGYLPLSQRSQRRKSETLQTLSQDYELTVETLEQIYDPCYQMEILVRTIHDNVVSLANTRGPAQPLLPTAQGTVFRTLPASLVQRKSHLQLAQIVGECTTPRTFEQGVNSGTIKTQTKMALKLVDQIADAVRKVSEAHQ